MFSLVSQTSNEYKPVVSTDNKTLYVALAERDEIYGQKPIDMYPEIIHITKEEFASQTFMTFVSIYGTQWMGQRSAVNLPLKYLDVDGRVYFDYVESNAVRGGRMPIMLVILKKNIYPLEEKLLDIIVEPFITNLVENWYKRSSEEISNSLFTLQRSLVANMETAFPAYKNEL